MSAATASRRRLLGGPPAAASGPVVGFDGPFTATGRRIRDLRLRHHRLKKA